MIKIFRKIHRRLQSLRSKVKEYHKRERIYHYGNENPDKIFYIICFDYETQGLFAIVKSVLSHIMYAVDKGWIPVVDLKNYSCQYQQKGENSWELFFEQPCGYTLEDISRSNRVVISYYGMYPYNQAKCKSQELHAGNFKGSKYRQSNFGNIMSGYGLYK